MGSLGVFGTRHEALEPDTFGWFDVQVRTNPTMTDLDLADFMETAGSLDITDARQALAALGVVKGFLRSSIHPDDFETFWSVAKANRQDLKELMQVAMNITEAVLGRPTGPASDFTGGPPGTLGNSSPDAASMAAAVAAKAYPDRPDLQVATLRAVS